MEYYQYWIPFRLHLPWSKPQKKISNVPQNFRLDIAFCYPWALSKVLYVEVTLYRKYLKTFKKSDVFFGQVFLSVFSDPNSLNIVQAYKQKKILVVKSNSEMRNFRIARGCT